MADGCFNMALTISDKDLIKGVNPVVYIHSDDDNNNNNKLIISFKEEITIDENGGIILKWAPDASKMFTIDVSAAPRLTLVIKLKVHGEVIGEVQLPIKNFLDSYGGAIDAKHVKCSVKSTCGKVMGVLDFPFKFVGAYHYQHTPAPPGYGGYRPHFAPTVPYQAPAGGYQHVDYYGGYRPHFPPASYGPYQAPAMAGYGYTAPPHKPIFSGVLAMVAQGGVMGLFHAFFDDMGNSFN